MALPARTFGAFACLLALRVGTNVRVHVPVRMSLFHEATFAANEKGGEEVHELDQIDIGDGYSVLIWRMLV